MKIELPSPRHALRGIVIEVHEVAGADLFSVTTWRGACRPPQRKWFNTRTIALAHAADRSDEFGLPIIDISDEAE